MPRPLRIEYAGACYHLMSRGDGRERIFADDQDRAHFLRTLGEACTRSGWRVDAYCLMSNHFHAVVETAQPNLGAGMQWLLGTYTQRFNRRHRRWGHVFGGRYKAQLIDERSPSYLVQACNYVHLNPARSGLVPAGERLERYGWSSYPAYLRPALRSKWLRVERLLGEHGLQVDSAKARRELSRRMEELRAGESAAEQERLRSGWKIGAEDFADWLADKLARGGREGEQARERREVDEVLAERLVQAGLREFGWSATEVKRRQKGDAIKVMIARRVRSGTPMTRKWIADRLHMGSASYLSSLLSHDDSKL
ncbi:MAG: transposase [Chthoniobacterales bacterium]|nr:transposase [Chthoniobacterales bacterium]